MSAIIYSA